MDMCFCDENVLKYESNVESAKRKKLYQQIMANLENRGKVGAWWGNDLLLSQPNPAKRGALRNPSAFDCKKKKIQS